MVHVVHVDDDPDVGEVTAAFLERHIENLSISSSTSGEAALEEVNGHVDCIVSDFEMRGMDGLELLDAVRDTHPDLPFILFTGRGSEEVASEAISKGVTDYLQKGAGTEQYEVLANRIQNAVARYRAEREAQRGYAAIEAASDGIALLDTNGDFLYVNEAYAELYGYDQSTVQNDRWERLHPEAEVDRFYDEILPTVTSSGTWSGRTTGKHRDGSTFVADHSITLTADDTTICVVRDLTEQQDRERALSVELTFLDDALDALDDVFYVFDNDGDLVWWNNRMNEVTGYTDDELRSMDPAEFVRPQDRERLLTYIETVIETGRATVEVELLTADGDTIPYEFTSTELPGGIGDAIGRVGIGRDIRLRKRAEWQLEREKQRLNEFASVLSHDLRNPLSVAMGHVDLMSPHVREAGIDSLETIESSLRRIDRIIEDVLALTRTGGTASEIEHVDLETLADRAWSAVDRGLTELTVDEPVRIHADESLLERLVMNLFRNAIEHGGEDVRVWMGPLEDADGFYVEDDGPGVPVDDREQVFDWQYSTKPGGTGVGLRSVEQICEAHDWSVSIADSSHGGARFEIRTGGS